MKKYKFNLFILSTLVFTMLSLTSCNITPKNDSQNDSQKVSIPTQEEQKQQRLENYRNNIAKYVKLHIVNNDVYITNDTEYTLECVTVALSWEEYDSDLGKYVTHTGKQSFNFIPAFSESSRISGYELGINVKAQITVIKCTAIGFY